MVKELELMESSWKITGCSAPIDPTKLTNYERTVAELEKMILWAICAAGKNGVVASKCLEKFLRQLAPTTPFDAIRKTVEDGITIGPLMKNSGIGDTTKKSIAFLEISHSNLDLKNCSVADLESIHGIGPKTARMFVVHSRKNQRYAVLDRHILSYLRDRGYKVPLHTPTKKNYEKIEKIFLDLADKEGREIAEWDLELWNERRKQ